MYIEQKLKRSLKLRHLIMIAIGGVIGSGFFYGVGDAIKLAGPMIIISYLLISVIIYFMFSFLIEMSSAIPTARSFSLYSEMAYGRWAGFSTGWTYWLAFLLGPASEVIVSGNILHDFFPNYSTLFFYFTVPTILSIINIAGIMFFGEIEFLLSFIKILFLIVFIFLGFSKLFNNYIHHININNFSIKNGFFSKGISGIFSSLFIVVYTFGGIEALTIAAEECKHPNILIAKTKKLIGFSLLLILNLSIIALLISYPWQNLMVFRNPFNAALYSFINSKNTITVVNFIILVASISCIDIGLYASSRMLFSLSRVGHSPKLFCYVNKKSSSPLYAIIASCFILYLGCFMYFFTPNSFYILSNLSGFGFLFTWLMIVLSHSKVRDYIVKNKLTNYSLPNYKYIRYILILILSILMFGEVFSQQGKKILFSGIIWLFIISIIFLFSKSSRYGSNELKN